LLNLSCGFAAILIADLHISSILILTGMFFDVIDGLAARLLKVQSLLGKELDSLADIISFGLAPAYLYTFISPVEHWTMYIPSFFILIGSALRLAIFNIRPDTKYFTGLPTPASSFFLIGLFIGVEFDSTIMQTLIDHPYIYISIPIILMYLNLSKIKMFSFKQVGKNLNYNLLILFCILTFALLTMINYKLAMPIGVIIYIILSLIYSFRIHK
jgi:CDP-diacylglycerol--serine O-phosphatidyltransferase